MKKTLKNLAPFFLGCLFVLIPLLGDFHFESALIAGTVGCFWGGIASSKLILKRDSVLLLKILRNVYLFGLPLFLFALFIGCLTLDGVLFWFLIPIPSVLFGISIGRFYRKLILPFPVFCTIVTLLLVSLGGLLIEFLLLPQVYFFNHVWGTWPGPIYDETVRVTSSFVYFRLITFGWILLLWLLPHWKASSLRKLIILLTTIALALGYFYLPQLGIITPRSSLQKTFAEYQTEHFDIYYAPENFTEEDIAYWALKHEFHFQQIIQQLEITWPANQKIESYLYANAWQKKDLVGAKFTSYVPIWLEQDQLHIAKQHLAAVLKHELVHVISKRFGNNLFNGSLSIGLIEGLAESIAKDASPQSTLSQIISAEPPYPSPQQMKLSLSPLGFYSSASSISYTKTGSFVAYLLENYPVSNFKEAYPNADFESAYEISFDSLVLGWHRSLPSIEIDSVDRQVSEFIYSQRSIFQKNCPHLVSPIMELWDTIQFHEANDDVELALPFIEELYEIAPKNLMIKRKWLTSKLENGHYGDVAKAVSDQDSIPAFLFLKADGFAMSGKWDLAYRVLDKIKETISDKDSSRYTYSFEIRQDSTNWQMFGAARYNELIPPSGNYNLSASTETLIAQEAINESSWGSLPSYGSIILNSTLNVAWFSTYEVLIDHLVYLQEFELAERWIRSVQELELRPRFQERLQEQKEWLLFARTSSEVQE